MRWTTSSFICDALPVSLMGMNSADMCDYIKYVADRLLVQLGVEKFFHKANPFEWAIMQGMENKTNFSRLASQNIESQESELEMIVTPFSLRRGFLTIQNVLF